MSSAGHPDHSGIDDALARFQNMSIRERRRRVNATPVVSAYTDPLIQGPFGGVGQYAQAYGLTQDEALRELQGELAYTLHSPPPPPPPSPDMGSTRSRSWIGLDWIG